MVDSQINRGVLKEFKAGVFLILLVFALTYLFMIGALKNPQPISWAIPGGLYLLYLLRYIYNQLHHNYVLETGEILNSFGLANILSITRGVLLGLLIGFLFIPKPVDPPILWFIGIVYFSSTILDFLDGFAARITGMSTLLGEKLDLFLDGFVVLVGSFLAVQFGLVPFLFLTVGFARYLYLIGIWSRKRMGLPVRELKPNPYRRALAGSQMGFLCVILLPIFSPTATKFAAYLFMIPFLIGFIKDWLWVSGVLPEPSMETPGGINRNKGSDYPKILLFLARICLFLFVWNFYSKILANSSVNAGPVVFLLVFGFLVLFGIATRLCATGILIMIGIYMDGMGLSIGEIIILVLGSLLVFFGPGKLSLWKPEEWLIYHRPGDKI